MFLWHFHTKSVKKVSSHIDTVKIILSKQNKKNIKFLKVSVNHLKSERNTDWNKESGSENNPSITLLVRKGPSDCANSPLD